MIGITRRLEVRALATLDLAIGLIYALLPARVFASSGFHSVRFPQPVGMHPWGVVFALLAVGLILPAAQRIRPATYVAAVGVWALFAAGFAVAFVTNYSSAMASSPGIVALGLYVAHAHYLDATHRIRRGD